MNKTGDIAWHPIAEIRPGVGLYLVRSTSGYQLATHHAGAWFTVGTLTTTRPTHFARIEAPEEAR